MREPVENAAGERKAARFEAKAVKADGSFEGYASLFGTEDLGRDVVMPGAFRKSLLKRGARGVKLLYQHEPNEVIGTWEEIKEDARGLFVRGQLLTDVRRARLPEALVGSRTTAERAEEEEPFGAAGAGARRHQHESR